MSQWSETVKASLIRNARHLASWGYLVKLSRADVIAEVNAQWDEMEREDREEGPGMGGA